MGRLLREIEEIHNDREGFGYRLSDRLARFIGAVVFDGVANAIEVGQGCAIDFEPKVFEPIAQRGEVDRLI